MSEGGSGWPTSLLLIHIVLTGFIVIGIYEEIISIADTDYHQEKDHFLWVSTLSDQLWIESEFSW